MPQENYGHTTLQHYTVPPTGVTMEFDTQQITTATIEMCANGQTQICELHLSDEEDNWSILQRRFREAFQVPEEVVQVHAVYLTPDDECTQITSNAQLLHALQDVMKEGRSLYLEFSIGAATQGATVPPPPALIGSNTCERKETRLKARLDRKILRDSRHEEKEKRKQERKRKRDERKLAKEERAAMREDKKKKHAEAKESRKRNKRQRCNSRTKDNTPKDNSHDNLSTAAPSLLDATLRYLDLEKEGWPEDVKDLYLDGNNMLYLTSHLRTLALNKHTIGKAEQLLEEVTRQFLLLHPQVQQATLLFDKLRNTRNNNNYNNRTLPSGVALRVCSARPHFRTSDEALIALAQRRQDVEGAAEGEPASVEGVVRPTHGVIMAFVTSDRALSDQLAKAGGVLIKPKAFLEYIQRKATGSESDGVEKLSLDDWLMKLIPEDEEGVNNNINEDETEMLE